MSDPARHILLTSAQELAARLGDRQLRIVDCRFDLMDPEAGREAWLEAHIPGAVYADLDRDLSGPVTADTGRHPLPAVERACETFSRLGIDTDTRVVAYDDASGAIASRAWWLLRWLGHRDVTLLDGGLQAWRSANLPLESGVREVTPRNFVATAGTGRVLTSQDVAANLGANRDFALIDARDAARFRGDAEPIDAKAGHIPGAKNVPYAECLREDGTWLDADALRRRLQPVIGDDERAPWAVMCGSGVTACHLALSGLLAGYSEPGVYVGSWSEWIRDPSRPIGPRREQ
ncbi:MAG TPA: sulfurtransferase [Woeseiaceae bacterium]|nr:sulfurtransferase [Woeseiaceae bacterium]